jgi:hypothetical protein
MLRVGNWIYFISPLEKGDYFMFCAYTLVRKGMEVDISFPPDPTSAIIFIGNFQLLMRTYLHLY